VQKMSEELRSSCKVVVVTLGCAKNQVDSEVLMGLLSNRGYTVVGDVSEAEIAVVNTCGFLESAVRENIDCILDVASEKEEGSLRKLIVVGCLVSRYLDELKENLPEVDAFLASNQLAEIVEAIEGRPLVEPGRAGAHFLYSDSTPRLLASPFWSAYVKIAEGCDHRCSFCTIPQIKGAFRSRSMTSILKEVEALAAGGVQEVNLIAQDLSSYGRDLNKSDSGSRVNLAKLLRELDRLRAVNWIRLLYTYPSGINKELLEAIGECASVCEYIDLPLQHCSERILQRMLRPVGKFSPRRVVDLIHSQQSTIYLRTTFIVGYPGETDKDIAELEAFVREGHFLGVGVFAYSPEDGTIAAGEGEQVEEHVKEERRQRLMLAQQEVLGKKMREMVGRRVDILLEGQHPETELLLLGRGRFQAPEVDGTVIINDVNVPEELIHAGELGEVDITGTAGYDLLGTLVSINTR
jgi:ribosomal protein S12 methylthiotransferase